MRILHTSDWHLGSTLGPASRDDEHRLFLDWLRQTLRTEDVDVLVIAGDIFDHAQPSAEAQSLYYRFLASLGDHITGERRGPRQVVVVGGNHDSPSRLDAPRDILGALRVSVVGGYERDTENRLIVPIFGDNSGRDLVGVIAAVPYINEYRLGVSARDLDKRAASVDAFTSLHARLADTAAAAYPGLPLVATGHLTCSTKTRIAPARASADTAPPNDDATISDDDFPQPIHNVGDLGALPPTIFDDRFSYVALGHIHRAFPPAAPRIWYSGTPVPVGFTETTPRRALLIDIPTALGAPAAVRTLTIPTWRDLIRIEGPPDAVLAKLENCRGDKDLPPLVDIHVLVPHYDTTVRQKINDVFRRLQKATASAPVQVNLRQSSLAARTEAATRTAIARDRALTPLDVFRLGWASKHGSPPPADILEAFESLRAAAAVHD